MSCRQTETQDQAPSPPQLPSPLHLTLAIPRISLISLFLHFWQDLAADTHTRTHTNTHKHTHAHAHVCVCVCVYCGHTQTHTHTCNTQNSPLNPDAPSELNSFQPTTMVKDRSTKQSLKWVGYYNLIFFFMF